MSPVMAYYDRQTSHRDRRHAVINTKHVPQRRGRPERGRRLGFRSSGIGGLTGRGSRGAVGNFARMERSTGIQNLLVSW
jgi:hypothetical protein